VLRVGEVLVTSPGWAGAGTAMRHRFAYLRGNGVWLAAVEGGDHTRLAALDGEVGEAQASPDGKRLWVSAGPWGERTVWAIDLASGERRAEAIASSFALSPDGRWLALAREKDAETPRGSAIAVLRDLATGEERPLLRSALDFPLDYGPQIAGWSRDGGTVFLHGDNGTESSDTVIAVDAGTGRVLRISGGRFGGTTAAGEVLVVGQRFRPQGGKDYFLFAGPPSEGAPWDRVTSRDHSELDASVSPDGLRVAFTTLADDGEWPTRRLCVVGLRGREWAVVLETEDAQTSVEGPQWSHDGEWLMASSTTSSPGGETRRSVRTVSSDGQRRGLLVEDAVPLCWVP